SGRVLRAAGFPPNRSTRQLVVACGPGDERLCVRFTRLTMTIRLRSAARVCAIATLLAVVATCATNPATGKRELSLVSEGQEIQMGLDGAKAAAAQMGIY